MAGTSNIARPLIKLVRNTAKLVGKLQVGINKILWGVNNQQPSVGRVSERITDSKVGYNFTQKTPDPKPPGKGQNLLTAGLFNALDLLAELDLCNIIASLTDMINIKKKPRNPPNGPWPPPAGVLYYIQDQCGEIRKFIDKYLAYPNEFIGSYLGVGPNTLPPQEALDKTGAPIQGGTAVQKYNIYFLMQSIKDSESSYSPPSMSIFNITSSFSKSP